MRIQNCRVPQTNIEQCVGEIRDDGRSDGGTNFRPEAEQANALIPEWHLSLLLLLLLLLHMRPPRRSTGQHV